MVILTVTSKDLSDDLAEGLFPSWTGRHGLSVWREAKRRVRGLHILKVLPMSLNHSVTNVFKPYPLKKLFVHFLCSPKENEPKERAPCHSVFLCFSKGPALEETPRLR
jgi:hypothetical protein